MWGSGGFAPVFLNITLDRLDWSPFTDREIAPDTNWVGGWVDHRATHNAMEKGKMSYTSQE
jgi:hypothetical protein